MRLSFAAASFLDPAVLLVDEVLAVGDTAFQQRCLDRLRERLAAGVTLVLVSHDLPAIEATCRRGDLARTGNDRRRRPDRLRARRVSRVDNRGRAARGRITGRRADRQRHHPLRRRRARAQPAKRSPSSFEIRVPEAHLGSRRGRRGEGLAGTGLRPAPRHVLRGRNDEPALLGAGVAAPGRSVPAARGRVRSRRRRSVPGNRCAASTSSAPRSIRFLPRCSARFPCTSTRRGTSPTSRMGADVMACDRHPRERSRVGRVLRACTRDHDFEHATGGRHSAPDAVRIRNARCAARNCHVRRSVRLPLVALRRRTAGRRARRARGLLPRRARDAHARDARPRPRGRGLDDAGVAWSDVQGPGTRRTRLRTTGPAVVLRLDLLVAPSSLRVAIEALESRGGVLLDRNWRLIRERMSG